MGVASKHTLIRWIIGHVKSVHTVAVSITKDCHKTIQWWIVCSIGYTSKIMLIKFVPFQCLFFFSFSVGGVAVAVDSCGCAACLFHWFGWVLLWPNEYSIAKRLRKTWIWDFPWSHFNLGVTKETDSAITHKSEWTLQKAKKKKHFKIQHFVGRNKLSSWILCWNALSRD